MKATNIKWCHRTFNPWTGNALGQGRKLTSDRYWMQAQRWANEAGRLGERHRVFCGPSADVFDSDVPDDWRTSLWM